MSYEDFFEGVRATLEKRLKIPVVDGFVEGPLEQELGCVYPQEDEEQDGDVDFILIDLRARVYRVYEQQFVPEEPAGNTELITTRAAIVEALKDKQAAQFGIWYFRIQGFEFNWAERWVEARVVGRMANPFLT